MDTEPEQMTKPRAIPADTLAHRLMLARAHAGHLSIREAADKCGIGRGAWTNWERGARPADLIELAELVSEHLGVDRDWLLFGGPLAEPERPRRRDRHGRRSDRLASPAPHRPASRPVDNRPPRRGTSDHTPQPVREIKTPKRPQNRASGRRAVIRDHHHGGTAQ